MGVRITPYLTVDYIRGLFVIVRFIAWVWLYGYGVFSTAVAYALSEVGKEGLVLKKEQLQTIRNGKDVFLWLPTGFGKSICYEVLPFLFDYKSSRAGPGNSTVLVVSPLVSLIVDQVCSRRSCRTFSRCSTRARNNFTVRVRKYFTHAQTVCTRPSPFFWEGPGYEARLAW